jgi:hypothetical protein
VTWSAGRGYTITRRGLWELWGTSEEHTDS